MVECLSNISENRIKDFAIGKEKFICKNCVTKVDVDTLTIGSLEVPELEELTFAEDGDDELTKLKHELSEKDIECAGVKYKYDLLSSSFTEVKKKIEMVEQNFKESIESIENQKLEIEKCERNNQLLETEKTSLKVEITRLKESMKVPDNE